jgi:predicted phospho-2-dehydro-3-deoxyheptonate aldolase
MSGKLIRLERIINNISKRTCIVPLDHGVTLGPIHGIKTYSNTVKQVIDGGADAIVLHKGLLKSVVEKKELCNVSYILHLSASTVLSEDSSSKILIGTVEEALKLGADGVSVHVNLGSHNESKMIRDLSMISRDCEEWGVPLLAMMYTKNKNYTHIMHAARIAEELGADIVKIDCPDIVESISEIVDSVNIPVLIAGGAKNDKIEELLTIIEHAIKSGMSGVAIGRNIFQYNQPKIITGVIRRMVHAGMSANDAINELKLISELKISCAI